MTTSVVESLNAWNAAAPHQHWSLFCFDGMITIELIDGGHRIRRCVSTQQVASANLDILDIEAHLAMVALKEYVKKQRSLNMSTITAAQISEIVDARFSEFEQAGVPLSDDEREQCEEFLNSRLWSGILEAFAMLCGVTASTLESEPYESGLRALRMATASAFCLGVNIGKVSRDREDLERLAKGS